MMLVSCVHVHSRTASPTVVRFVWSITGRLKLTLVSLNRQENISCGKRVSFFDLCER